MIPLPASLKRLGLDLEYIDHVAALMHAPAHRVRFVFASPTNAESLRLFWCDLRLAFLRRDPSRAYSPGPPP